MMVIKHFDMLSYILLFCSTILLSFLLISALMQVFTKLDIVDNPKKYNKKRAPIPYSMGVVFYLCFFMMSALFMDITYKLILIWLFWALVTCISFLDDLFQVSAKKRLLMQIFIWLVIGLTSIKIGYVSNIFGGIIDLDVLWIHIFGLNIFLIPVLFTVVWYVFVFNALNWSDGIGGNTSGLSIICFLILFLLWAKLYLTDTYDAGLVNARFIMEMSLILVAILIPFFVFDLKEKILMGDSGTMFLWFMLATLAIISGGKVATVLAVFGIYAVDAVYVIARRLVKRKNPLTGDFTHFHHRLMKLWFSPLWVLVVVFSLSFIFGVSALFLDRFWKILVFLIIIFVVLGLSHFGRQIKKISFKK